MERLSMTCVKDCKLLAVTGVLTLDDDGMLMYFCDQCALNPTRPPAMKAIPLKVEPSGELTTGAP